MGSTTVLRTVQTLLNAVDDLEQLYPGRRFTLDGHLVGSIGEVLAAELYGLSLYRGSTECHDASCPLGKQVQIKLTQRSRVSIYNEPDYLIVLRLNDAHEIEEIYNGPGPMAWRVAGKMQKNGQRPIGTNKVMNLMQSIDEASRIDVKLSPEWFVPAPPPNRPASDTSRHR